MKESNSQSATTSVFANCTKSTYSLFHTSGKSRSEWHRDVVSAAVSRRQQLAHAQTLQECSDELRRLLRQYALAASSGSAQISLLLQKLGQHSVLNIAQRQTLSLY